MERKRKMLIKIANLNRVKDKMIWKSKLIQIKHHKIPIIRVNNKNKLIRRRRKAKKARKSTKVKNKANTTKMKR